MKKSISLLVLALASPALAEGSRELDSHEHGVGSLNIAVEGTTVAMEFHAPGADIVGFEYAAQSAEDRAAIDAAVATLARPMDLFVMPAAAECTVVRASAALKSEAEHDEHDEHDGHDEHDEHDGHDEHDEHDEHHDDHAAADHDDAAAHTEFHAEYTMNCANPDALRTIEFAYFGAFENARELEIQVISGTGARAFEVERDDPILDLRGMF